MTQRRQEECLVPFHQLYPMPCPNILMELLHGL